ncbi:MAG: hypothetical protein M4579_001050 [Chaenotheca gracillima]|nr:MAG: hypothetical protein M4579_001050 [Chaenotheca gracillima]
MPIRNPFKKTPGAEALQDENARPGSRSGGNHTLDKPSVNGSKPGSSAAVSIKSKENEPNEYKLSVVNDSGIYLPPSPPEKKGFWHRSTNATTPSNHRSLLSENEPFSISRESFESYRRSFDISARSPIAHPDTNTPRQSLDSRRSQLSQPNPRSNRSFESQPSMEEEQFEDVGLNDDTKPKKRSIFSRFGDSSETPAATANPNVPTNPGAGHRGFHFTGRKRGASGQGAELGSIDRPQSSGAPEVKVDH